jgi:tetratricopeptide (TPR) repeat protein
LNEHFKGVDLMKQPALYRLVALTFVACLAIPGSLATAQGYIPAPPPRYRPKPDAKPAQVSTESYNYYLAGLQAYNRKNYSGALELMNQSIRLSPNNELAWYVTGVIYHIKKQYSVALEAYNRTLQINPLFRKAYGDRSSLYKQIGQPALAEADWQRFLSLGQ